jgi:hypothetical protein
MGVSVALLLEVSRNILSYPGCGLFYVLPFGVMGVEGEIRLSLFLDVHGRSLHAQGSRFMFVYVR